MSYDEEEGHKCSNIEFPKSLSICSRVILIIVVIVVVVVMMMVLFIMIMPFFIFVVVTVIILLIVEIRMVVLVSLFTEREFLSIYVARLGIMIVTITVMVVRV